METRPEGKIPKEIEDSCTDSVGHMQHEELKEGVNIRNYLLCKLWGKEKEIGERRSIWLQYSNAIHCINKFLQKLWRKSQFLF